MDTTLFSRFAPVIRSLSAAELADGHAMSAKLLMARSQSLEVCYAPFEYVNPQARIVIVGITPGRQQMRNAVQEAHRQLDRGASDLQALQAAKQVGAFSGDMRTHLVNLLNEIGINSWLGIASCEALFSSAAHLVQTASVLRFPVFYKGKDYNGTPRMTHNPLLRDQLLMHFAQDLKTWPNAVFVPLGEKAADALQFLVDKGYLERNRILAGLPHPSPANAERIAYFLGRKRREALSEKTNADKIDQARSQILHSVQALA